MSTRTLVFFSFAILVFALLVEACTPGGVTYNTIRYKIYTGGDNLDGGKSAAVGIFSVSGGPTNECVLNANPPATTTGIPPIPGLGSVGPYATWNNDSTQVIVCPPGSTITVAQLLNGGSVQINMYQKSCDTFCDNWDLEGLEVEVLQNNTNEWICEAKIGYWGPGNNGEHPAIARLKGGQGNSSFVVASTQAYPIGGQCS